MKQTQQENIFHDIMMASISKFFRILDSHFWHDQIFWVLRFWHDQIFGTCQKFDMIRFLVFSNFDMIRISWFSKFDIIRFGAFQILRSWYHHHDTIMIPTFWDLIEKKIPTCWDLIEKCWTPKVDFSIPWVSFDRTAPTTPTTGPTQGPTGPPTLFNVSHLVQ